MNAKTLSAAYHLGIARVCKAAGLSDDVYHALRAALQDAEDTASKDANGVQAPIADAIDRLESDLAFIDNSDEPERIISEALDDAREAIAAAFYQDDKR